MQVPRFFLLFSALLLVVAVVNVNAAAITETATETDTDTEVEARNPAFAVAVGIIRQAFKWAAKHCLEEAARNCKQHWKHAHALRDCAKGFLHNNRGRCVVG